jgi:hypothetical protein
VSLAARIRALTGVFAAGLLLPILFLLPSHAGAQDAAKPTPCTGEMLITDPAGDQSPGGPNQDIKGVFLNFKDGKLTANLQITNLSKELPSTFDSQGGAYWYVFYTDGDTRRFVKAVNADGATIEYAQGTLDPLTGVFTTGGDTSGQFIEGPDGIISIEIPAEAGGAAGKTLAGVMATADDILGLDDFIGLNQNVDVAPDDASVVDGSGGGVPYTVTACPTTPVPGGGTTTTPTGTGTTTTPTSTVLPLKVTKVLDGAKKAQKKKAIRITVSAGETITDLSLTLKPKSGKGKIYASVKVATLSGTKTLKLKRKAKLKAGSYALVAKGKVGGTVRKAMITVKVKK